MPAIPASHQDLLNGEFATLGTVGPDGRPQLSEVWFLADDDTVKISLNYLEIRGDAEVTPDDDYSFADRSGAKNHADLRDHDGPGDRRVIVTVKPTRLNAVGMRG